MRFKKIKLSNIRSYAEQELEFPEGSVLLSGDVGSGKTSILMAIEYALFGLQPGQKGTSLLRNNQELGGVTLDLEIEDIPIKIERRLKRTARGVSNEYASITLAGDKFESSVTEIKSRIVSLLGYPPEFIKKNNVLYRYTVHSPQEQMKQIVLEDPEIRLNTLRHIFGMDKYKRIKENLSILLSNLKSNSKILQGEVKDLEQTKKELESRKLNLNSIENKIRSAEIELQKNKNLRKEKEDQIKEIRLKIEERKSFNEEIEKTKILIGTKKEFIQSLVNEENEINSLIKDVGKRFDEEQYFNLLKSLKEKKDSIETLNSALIDLRGSISASEKEMTTILTKKERIFKIDICPTCLQDVAETHKHNILNETETKMKEIEKALMVLKEQQKESSIKIETQKNEIRGFEEEKSKLEILKTKHQMIEKSRTRLKDLVIQKNNLEKDIGLLTQHITSLKEKILKYSAYENIFVKAERELQEAHKAERQTDISLAESKKELELSKKEIDFFSGVIKSKEEAKEKQIKLDSLIDWLSSQFLKLIELIESNVLLNLRQQFSNLFRKWFLMLIPENSLDSQIDENFTPIIIQREAEMDYDFLSGGERTAVALAYRLALNQTINSLMSRIKTKGLIVLDEPTDGFSEAQVNKIRDILDELDAEQLIIVSHEQKIESFVDNVLKIAKTGDTSNIEEEV